MSIEYFALIFFASLAVIQAASAWQNLQFILFLRNRYLTIILAFMVIIASYYWFFYLGGRHVRDTGGNKQLLLFPIAILSGIVFNFFFSSLINARRKKKDELKKEIPALGEGIEVLREMTYWQALRLLLFQKKK